MLKKYIPQPLKTLVKDQIMVFIKDSLDSCLGRRGKYIPPTRLMFDGPIGIKEFISNGQEFKKLFMTLVKPKPSFKILDIGSGIGRKTLTLTNYLNKQGSYDGMEIVKKGVDWCQKNITSRFPNFKFICVDIYNGFYNPKGKIRPNKFRFPYPDNFYDVVIATSVFTHMLPDDVENYHKEIARVLRKGGRSYLTYFIINSDSKKRLPHKDNTMPFVKVKQSYWTTVPKTPEIAVAYEERQIRAYHLKAGLKIKAIYYGGWSGRDKSLSYQDIVISTK